MKKTTLDSPHRSQQTKPETGFKKSKGSKKSKRLDVHEVAMEAAVLVAVLCNRVSGLMASAADQAIRSASSVPAHLMEGLAFQGKARIHRWRIGYGEAQEADRHLTLLIATKTIPEDEGTRALELLDRTRAMLWRLMHPKS